MQGYGHNLQTELEVQEPGNPEIASKELANGEIGGSTNVSCNFHSSSGLLTKNGSNWIAQ